MTDSLKFQLETANKKAEDFAAHIDRNILYQIILMFISILILNDPEKFSNYRFTELLNLDSAVVLKIVPFILIFLFVKLGLSLKRYNDLRVYLDEKSNTIQEVTERDKILLFTSHASAEMFYSIRKYPKSEAISVVETELKKLKGIGIFNIQFFSIAFAFFLGFSKALIIWLLYLYIQPLFLSGILIVLFAGIAIFSYRDFVKTTENKSFESMVYQVLVFFILGLLYFIWR
jgi:hypothetical protein